MWCGLSTLRVFARSSTRLCIQCSLTLFGTTLLLQLLLVGKLLLVLLSAPRCLGVSLLLVPVVGRDVSNHALHLLRNSEFIWDLMR